MEKRTNIKRIILTGPESTGKSCLCQKLAKHYKTICINEYAREYVENINRKYTYEDVIHIAEKQIYFQSKDYKNANKFIFFDTSLIITKIWLKEVYGIVPKFINNFISNRKYLDLFLLCYFDIDWIKDDVRENGGEKRKYLFDLYENELKANELLYKIIRGKENIRFDNAVKLIELSLIKYR